MPVDTSYHGVKVVGKIDQLGDYLANGGYDEITITLPLNDYDRLEELVAQCEKSGVHTKFIPDYSSLFPSNPYTEDVQGLPVINIRYVPLTNSFNRMSKRLVDIVGSLLAIILFSPVMLAGVEFYSKEIFAKSFPNSICHAIIQYGHCSLFAVYSVDNQKFFQSP